MEGFCLGGPYDGQWQEHEGNRIVVALPIPVRLSSPKLGYESTISVSYTTYEPDFINGELFWVYQDPKDLHGEP